MSRRSWKAGAGWLAGAAGAAASYSLFVEPRWYRLRHETVPALRPSATRPLRLLHLSDLHLLPGQDDKHAFIRSCLTSGPDLVVVTGDVLGHPRAIDPAVRLLADVGRGRLAVVVLGSNDVYAPQPRNPVRYFTGPSDTVRAKRMDTDRLVQGLADAGWEWVDNRRLVLQTPAGPVDLAGLGDAHIGHDRPGQIDWAPPSDDVALRLGVAHAPYLRVLDVFSERGFDVALAGHTHGGQLRVPFWGALVDNCDLPLRQARGLSRHTDTGDGSDTGLWLHVSAGLGASMYAPMRFACRPEATVIDLVARRPRVTAGGPGGG